MILKNFDFLIFLLNSNGGHSFIYIYILKLIKSEINGDIKVSDRKKGGIHISQPSKDVLRKEVFKVSVKEKKKRLESLLEIQGLNFLRGDDVIPKSRMT